MDNIFVYTDIFSDLAINLLKFIFLTREREREFLVSPLLFVREGMLIDIKH